MSIKETKYPYICIYEKQHKSCIIIMIKTLILILLISPYVFLAQSDSDAHQQLVYTYIYNKEYTKAKKEIDLHYINSKSTSKKTIGYIYLARYYSEIDSRQKEIEALQQAENIAKKTKNQIDLAYVKYGFASHYLNIKRTELFIKAVHESIQLFSKYKHENFMLSLLYDLKSNDKSHKVFDRENQDYLKANMYAHKSGNNTLISTTYNNLGYFYKRMFDATKEKKYLDSANTSYSNSHKYALKIKNSISKKKNLIFYYLNMGSLNHDKPKIALTLYKECLSLSEHDISYNEVTALVYGNIGMIYMNAGNLDSAQEYLLKAYKISKNNRDIAIANKITILKHLSSLYEKLNKTDTALIYEKEAIKIAEKDYEHQIKHNTKALELYYQTEQKKQQIERLKNSTILYRATITFSAIIILFVIYKYRSKLKINIQRTYLLEESNNRNKLRLKLEKEEKSRLKREQEQLQKQALATSLQLNQKAILIDKLKERIKERRDIHLEKMLKEEQFIDQDFNSIQNIIQGVHPNFIKRLNEISINRLTALDIKYAAYIYLNMDNQQISNILKSDPKAVRMAKYRLKQKLGLNKDEDLQSFIQSLEL